MIGSNVLNIGLILGLTAVIRKIRVKSEVVKKELPIMVLMTLAFEKNVIFNGIFKKVNPLKHDGKIFKKAVAGIVFNTPALL